MREDYGHHAGAITSHHDQGGEGEEDNTISLRKHASLSSSAGAEEEELDIWCEECEGHGHRTEECPYAGDVF